LAPELRFDPQSVRAKVGKLLVILNGCAARIGVLAGDHSPEAVTELQAVRKAMATATEELSRVQPPFLIWTGKAEKTNFEVDTVSLHVHEKIDPPRILKQIRTKETAATPLQGELFEHAFHPEPLRDAVDFYGHERGWSNRLIAGDSLLVMNSLLRKESMAGQVQMIYIDPPYGIEYGSNFQPFTNQRDVKDRVDSDLTQEPEMIKAFRDTWELDIHSYLTYLRDRLFLARELLSESGSIFVQISDENVHLVRNLLDEIFGVKNHICDILVKKKGSQKSTLMDPVNDYVVWYGRLPRESGKLKFQPLYEARELDAETIDEFSRIEMPDGSVFNLKQHVTTDGEKLDFRAFPKRVFDEFPGGRLFRPWPITNGGERAQQMDPVVFDGHPIKPPKGRCWSHTSKPQSNELSGMERNYLAGRLIRSKSALDFKRYLEDFPYKTISNWWDGFGGASNPIYVVQTNERIAERCILMTTDPGDLVLDITCGSGTTAYVAEKWGRRWITCDTSRVAVTLAKQRLMTASFDYYALRYPNEGVRSGFNYKVVNHITSGAIANNSEIDGIYNRMHPAISHALDKLKKHCEKKKLDEWDVPLEFPNDWPEKATDAFAAFHEARQAMQAAINVSIAAQADPKTLYDKPLCERTKLRVTGPFTVEATPFPTVLSLESAAGVAAGETGTATSFSASIARSGETSRQSQWKDELLKTGIRGKGGQRISFTELETLPGTRYLHASGSTDDGQAVAVSFGPEHASLEQRQVALAIEEAQKLVPKPKFVVFCAFAFDPEAAKDVDEMKWPGVTLLKAQMNPDLLTEDLKKGRSSSDSFWLMGQPDVVLRPIRSGADKGKWEVEVNGFDYFDTRTGELQSGGSRNIAVWMLDSDYDGRSIFPHQVFFPMAGSKDGWQKLAKDIKAQLDEEKLEAFSGTVSLPFSLGDNRRIAVKVVDDRGIESLRVINVEEAAT
jgi:adenine-specific DNA-methyltransferase